jgi:hypothetical protein
MHPQRYTRVSWGLVRQSDLEPQGDPETMVETSRMRIFGLLIKAGDALLPEGATHAMLAIRAVETGEPGGHITMALSATLPLHHTPVQSNPRRYAEDEGDQA